MDRTVCELFAGVGGFRCGLNNVTEKTDCGKNEKWDTVWFNQWEPAEKSTQYAHDCYVYNFGTCLDKNGEDTTNVNIEEVDKKAIPDFNLLVGGFPCQDYSVASSLASSKGIEGKKGVLWWSIRDILEEKKPPFVLLENVDRLLKSPAKQRGRDFAIILGCFRDEGYTVEWRVINAADYGYQQRRRRVFIFAYREDTEFSLHIKKQEIQEILTKEGFFARTFKVGKLEQKVKMTTMASKIGDISATFCFDFENAGIMTGGTICTAKVSPLYEGRQITLGDIKEVGYVDEKYFIPNERLYYTNKESCHSDETEKLLPKESRRTWQYIKGAKRYYRKAANGYEYVYSEGPVPMIDEDDKPARTLLTSEGSFSRTTHIIRDTKTGKIRLLTPEETERIQGFPTGHTEFCKSGDEIFSMPINKRRFMMGNALVVNLIKDMEVTLSDIFSKER